MTRRTAARLALPVLAIILGACEPKKDISLTLIPSSAEVLVTQSVSFQVMVRNSTNAKVTWSLSGAGCAGAACGTIASDGRYTAPETPPDPPVVTVTATSTADPSRSVSADITVLPMANVWTWIDGSNVANEAGRYGAIGIPGPTNSPGARGLAMPWTDASGHLWLFGGSGLDSRGWTGPLNDLWRYDPATNEWTWICGADIVGQYGVYGVKGSPAPANVPGARSGANTWVGPDGRFWLFGGYGLAGSGEDGALNDLWRYDPAANEWTWVAGGNSHSQLGHYGIKGLPGTDNIPGGRWQAASWIDPDGKFWLFGGEGFDAAGGDDGFLNDLWRFDPLTLEWTWVSGDQVRDPLGRYGTKGLPDAANAPGGRNAAAAGVDAQGNLWLFGGWGWGAVHSYIPGCLNDLWRFDRVSLQWTWTSGSDILDRPGLYGTKGVPSPANVPGAREWSASWADPSGDLYLFGGYGFCAGAVVGSLVNDLWKYDHATGEWTWMGGGSVEARPGNYGTAGAVALTNVPGARNSGVVWTVSDGIWLFGGGGYYAELRDGLLNDLWRYLW